MKLTRQKRTRDLHVKSFRLQGKSFFLTYPKCPMEKREAMSQLGSKVETTYMCVAHELHEDGTDHLHALLQTKDKLSTKRQDFFDLLGIDGKTYHGNYQTAKDAVAVKDYVEKTADFDFSGTFLSNKQSDLQKRVLENKKIIQTPLCELVDTGEISIFSYQQLVQAKNLYLLDKMVVPEYQPRTCYWIYGKSGIGKSRWMRDNYPGQFFNKPQNKWWDGYHGESIILLDDFDLKGECLGHYLKIWGDCYSFNAEVKGSTIRPSYTMFVITSQYLPKDIFCRGDDQKLWDSELKDAIERRFQVKTILNGELVNNI